MRQCKKIVYLVKIKWKCNKVFFYFMSYYYYWTDLYAFDSAEADTESIFKCQIKKWVVKTQKMYKLWRQNSKNESLCKLGLYFCAISYIKCRKIYYISVIV